MRGKRFLGHNAFICQTQTFKNSSRCLSKFSQLPNPLFPWSDCLHTHADRYTDGGDQPSGSQVSGTDHGKFPDVLVIVLAVFSPKYETKLPLAISPHPTSAQIHVLMRQRDFVLTKNQCLKYLDQKSLLSLLFTCGSVLMTICWFEVRLVSSEYMA